ncbi:MAG: hypothetical protein GX444_06960 [Myxococcales bacterium]|nr:hypothetical protein [Myxococcales bacterium]
MRIGSEKIKNCASFFLNVSVFAPLVLYLLIKVLRILSIPAFLGALAAMAALIILLRSFFIRNPRRLQPIRAVSTIISVYYVFKFTYLYLGPAAVYTALPATVATGLVFFAVRSRRLAVTVVLALVWVLLVAFVGAYMWQYEYSYFFISLTSGLLLAALGVVFRKITLSAAMILPCWLVVPLVYAWVAMPHTWEAAKVEAQPGVKMLFQRQGSGIYPELRRGGVITIIKESCDGKRLFIGYKSLKKMRVIDRIAGRKLDFPEICPLEFDLPYDCSLGVAYVSDCERRSTIFKARLSDQPAIFARFPTPLENLQWFIPNRALGTGLARNEHEMVAIQANELHPDRLPTEPFDLTSNPATNEQGDIVVLSHRDSRLHRYRINETNHGLVEVQSSPPLSLVGPMDDSHLIFAPSGRLYLSAWNEGDLLEFDASTLTVLRRLPLAPGIRFLSINPRDGLLYVAGHFSKMVYIVDLATMTVKRQVFVGLFPRLVTFSQDGLRAYVPSAAGGIVMDLPTILPPPLGGAANAN